MRRRVCRWIEEGGKGGRGSKGCKGIGDGLGWLRYRKLGRISFDRESEGFALALKKRTGSVGCPFWRRFVAGALRFEGFLHLGELQLCFGQGLHDEAFGVFRGQVASGGHFADEEILGAL
jgi:hypothetical protein